MYWWKRNKMQKFIGMTLAIIGTIIVGGLCDYNTLGIGAILLIAIGGVIYGDAE